MRTFKTILLLCAASLLLQPVTLNAQSDMPPLALINGTLIDGTGSDPVPDAVVVIQGNRIVAVGPRAAITIPADAEIIDVGGATILPGIINTHVHDGFNAAYLTGWAQAGVTTVRDLGIQKTIDWPEDDLSIPTDDPNPIHQLLLKAFAIRDLTWREPTYARIVTYGPFVNVPDGYGGVVYPVSTPEEVQQAVDTLLALGADGIKTALDDGRVIRKTLPILSPELFAALVDAAHAHGARVALHVMRSDQLAMAIDAGVDEIVHMPVDRLPDDVIAQAVDQDVVWVPTLELWDGVSRAHGMGFITTAIDNLSRFIQAGGRVALGTDFHGYYTPFEEGLPITEIELMQRAGMTPMQIIVAATQEAAFVCNRADDLGTLEVGKLADILVVTGDPLDDLHALLDVRWVLRDGIVIRAD